MLQIGKPVKFATLRDLSRAGAALSISESAYADIDRGAQAVAAIVRRGQPAYGVNTGFGRLAQTHIPNDQLELLQRNLVLSHAVGVGDPLPAGVVRLMLALKVVALARGFSGVRRQLVDALVALYNADVLPRVPAKGSVGASGDLAPLAHLSAVLLGVGEVECGGRVMPAAEGLKLAGLGPVTLAAKEGLALLNGTQTSTALALWNLFAIDNLYATAIVAGALSVDAAEGSASPFDARIHELRGHPGQIAAASAYRQLLADSPINSSHRECGKVQDPYSLRCQPQVMGACSDQMKPRARCFCARRTVSPTIPWCSSTARPTRPTSCRAATSMPSRWPSPRTISHWPWPRSARSPSAASRCSSTPRSRACHPFS